MNSSLYVNEAEFLKIYVKSTQSKSFRPLWILIGSLLCLKLPVICHYSEETESSPHLSIVFP